MAYSNKNTFNWGKCPLCNSRLYFLYPGLHCSKTINKNQFHYILSTCTLPDGSKSLQEKIIINNFDIIKRINYTEIYDKKSYKLYKYNFPIEINKLLSKDSLEKILLFS